MNELVQAIQNTIDSREIAEMMEVEHSELLKKLEGTKRADKSVKQAGIIPIMTRGEIPVSDYFILYSYKDISGKENKCYLFTKIGCDFIANKFQGEKGILFSAKYVKKFAEMEKQINEQSKLLSPTDQLELQLVVLKEQNIKIDAIKVDMDDLRNNAPLYNSECKELQALVRKVGIKALGGYKSLAYNDNSLRGKIYADIQHQLKREFGVERYEAIKRVQLETARKIVEEYKTPTILINQISKANSEISCDREVI